jgi:hypothetical protein
MANQVAARLSGDDYQHLFAWQFVLELLMPQKNVLHVTVEDAQAGSVDDVTIRHESNSNLPDQFYQIKYHVDHRKEYSTQALIEHKPGEASLLEKFWQTWQFLRGQDSQRNIELRLVSNWTWDAKDKLKSCIDGHDNSVKDEFLTASPRSDLGKLRKLWQSALGATDDDFQSFIKCLRFRLGYDCAQELEQRLSERMENLKLKSDASALLVAVGIVRGWIKKGKQELSRIEIEKTLKEHDLLLPEKTEQAVTIYLVTVKAQKFDLEPDFIVDWRDYFIGDANKKGHQLSDPMAWNPVLLPQLYELESQINQQTDCRLIRARGLARLSAWFAFGYAFSDVARNKIEIAQNDRLWRTDAIPNEDFCLRASDGMDVRDGEIVDGSGETVAVGISVTGALDEDVRNFMASRSEKIASLLLLRPERELGKDCLRDGGDAVALASQVKETARNFAKRWSAQKMLLFYFGPLSGACFIGHKLNAVCRQIQIMEDQQPGYSKSFLLT